MTRKSLSVFPEAVKRKERGTGELITWKTDDIVRAPWPTNNQSQP